MAQIESALPLPYISGIHEPGNSGALHPTANRPFAAARAEGARTRPRPPILQESPDRILPESPEPAANPATGAALWPDADILDVTTGRHDVSLPLAVEAKALAQVAARQDATSGGVAGSLATRQMGRTDLAASVIRPERSWCQLRLPGGFLVSYGGDRVTVARQQPHLPTLWHAS